MSANQQVDSTLKLIDLSVPSNPSRWAQRDSRRRKPSLLGRAPSVALFPPPKAEKSSQRLICKPRSGSAGRQQNIGAQRRRMTEPSGGRKSHGRSPKSKNPRDLSTSGAFTFKSLAVTYSGMPERHTTIGAERFHFRVRNGIGWFPLAMAARQTVRGSRGRL